jgi:hypothetical protein
MWNLLPWVSRLYVVVVRSGLELEAFEDRFAVDDVEECGALDRHVDEVDGVVRVRGELCDEELGDKVDWWLDFLHRGLVEDLGQPSLRRS